MFKIRNNNGSSKSIREFYCPTVRECCHLDVLTPEEKKASARHAYYEVISKMKNLFFWGYPVDEVAKSNFFDNLAQFLYYNFGRDDFSVEIFNTLVMFALYQEKSSRIIQIVGRANGRSYQTDWVEFCHHDTWYVVDHSSLSTRTNSQLYLACDVTANLFKNIRVKKIVVVEHDFFWEPITIKRLNYLLRDARTSRFWLELCYSNWSDEMLEAICQMEDLTEDGQQPDYVMVSPTMGSTLEINQARIDALMRS